MKSFAKKLISLLFLLTLGILYLSSCGQITLTDNPADLSQLLFTKVLGETLSLKFTGKFTDAYFQDYYPFEIENVDTGCYFESLSNEEFWDLLVSNQNIDSEIGIPLEEAENFGNFSKIITSEIALEIGPVNWQAGKNCINELLALTCEEMDNILWEDSAPFSSIPQLDKLLSTKPDSCPLVFADSNFVIPSPEDSESTPEL